MGKVTSIESLGYSGVVVVKQTLPLAAPLTVPAIPIYNELKVIVFGNQLDI